MTDIVQYEQRDHVARIWLNRPHKRNACNDRMVDELTRAFDEADADDRVRVIVLRGRGNTFCSGFDLGEMRSDVMAGSTGMRFATKAAGFANRVYNTTKPVVAVLEGYVTAGGFELMISCDFAIADDDARIGDFHIRRALIAGAGPIYRLPRIVGIRKAKELMLTGKLLTGRQAAEWGLINDSVPASSLDGCVEEFVGQLADKSPHAMWITKMTVDRSLDADTESLLVMERLALANVLASRDAQEGVAAFLEKRPPVWQGR
jgi:enoyl-CoA hydratase/carnithine racemase